MEQFEFTDIPIEDKVVLEVLDGWKVKQYWNLKARRWYVTISVNSPFARQIKRHRLLRSHYVYMRGTGTTEIPEGYLIHHMDFNSRRDVFSNLELLTYEAHDKLHKEYTALFGFPKTFLGRKHKPETITLLKEIAQARGNNDIWDSPKTHHFESTKAVMSENHSGANNPMFRVDLDPKAISDFYDKCRSLKQTATQFGCSVAAIRYRLDSKLYERKTNPLTGRGRTYQFEDAEMAAFYESNGGIAAAEKYGCSPATVYYRVKTYKKGKLAA